MASTWFYTDSSYQQQGPVSLGELRAKYTSGEVKDDSLVWDPSVCSGWVELQNAPVDIKPQAPPPPAPRGIASPVPPARVYEESKGPAPPARGGAPVPPSRGAVPAPPSRGPAPPARGGAPVPPSRGAVPSPPSRGPAPPPRGGAPAPPSRGAAPAPTAPAPPAPPAPRAAAVVRGRAGSRVRSVRLIQSMQGGGAGGGWVERKTADGVAYYHNTTTGELTWDLPKELMPADQRGVDQGNWFWIPHAEQGYVPGVVLSVDASGCTQVQLQTGQAMTLKAKRRFGGRGEAQDLAALKLSSLQRLEPDLVLLDSLDEGLMLHNIRERYMKDEIYSNIGSICISVNPYQRLPLYSLDQMDRYNRRGNRVLPPHVFAVADNSFKRLVLDGQNQSILISGESGAGKTEATKQCLSYIAEVAGSELSVGDVSIEQKVLSVNPILEAFGNAKTLRNDNSSRFGRFTEIFFSGAGRISGAKIENYLLEKSRIAHQQAGERNYHIFYQICADRERRVQFGLGDAGQYQALSGSGCLEVAGVDDAAEFQEVLTSMRDLGIAAADVDWILELVASALHLSNVDFHSDGREGSVLSDAAALASAAQLLGVDAKALEACVLTRTMEVRGELMTVPLKPHEAKDGCSALAKDVYGKLFDWLVRRANDAIIPAGGTGGKLFIGILDIFGFEIFEHNSFEQLCINFANEWLQRLFNEHTFKEEEEVYHSEGIDFEHVDFIDNLPVLQLIEKKPHGLLPVADDEVRTPRATDLTFVNKIDRYHDKNPHFKTSSRALRGKEFFAVHHYAGEVIYNATGFLAKNRDELLFDMYNTMSGSSSERTRVLFPVMDKKDRQKHSLAGQFRTQLARLVKSIRGTSTEYIRCIKPNPSKAPRCFDAQMVLEQLRYSGVFEATKIRKTGFPFRYTFARFVEFYKCIMLQGGKWVPFRSAPSDHLGRCREILATSGQPPAAFANIKYGRTMLLYQSAEHRLLSLLRNLSLERVCSKIQAIVRGMITRRFVGLMMEARPVLEAAIASMDTTQLEAAISKATAILGAYGHMVSVQPPELARAKALREALEAWDKLAAQLDAALRQDLQDEGVSSVLHEARES